LLYGKWIIQYFVKHKEIEELKKAMRNFILQQVGEYVPVITPKIFLKLFFSGSKIWGFKLKQVASFAYHKNKTSLKTKTA
jgi:hypothetical protein